MACLGPAIQLTLGAIMGSFVGILYATISLIIVNVITCLGSKMCDCVDVMNC